MTFKWDDPMVLKAGAGVGLYALGGSRMFRLVGLALVGWAAWDYLKAGPAPPSSTKTIPYDPDAPLPLTQGQTSSADPFKGTRWENSPNAPSVRPARPGETDATGKVIPFARVHAPTAEEKAMFYGINPEPGGGDNVG